MGRFQLRTATNFAAAGFAAEGTFGGATSGIGSGVGFEPLYFVNAEDELLSLVGWRRPSNTDVLEGNGAGSPVEEVLWEGDIKFNSVSSPFNDLGFVRWIFHIGDNSIGAPKGLVAMFVEQSGGLRVQIGLDASVNAYQHFNAGSAFDIALTDLAWHRVKVTFKKTTLPLNVFHGADMVVTCDGVVMTPDSTFNAVGYWDSSVPRFITMGGTSNNSSWELSIGDVLISDDITDQLYAPTDDLVWDLNFENGTKKVNLRHPSDDIDPIDEPAPNYVVTGPGALGQNVIYNRRFLEDTDANSSHTRWQIVNSFPQSVNMWDSDFTLYFNFPTDILATVGQCVAKIADSLGGLLFQVLVDGTGGANNININYDSVNNTWNIAGPTWIDITDSELDDGVSITVKFVESTGVLTVYHGATLILTRTLISVDTPKIANQIDFQESNGTGGGIIKEARIYDVAHSGEVIASIVDLHGASNSRVMQMIFDENLDVAHSGTATWESTGGDPDVDGWNLDISGVHPIGAEPTYGRSFFSTISGDVNAEYSDNDIPVDGGEIDDFAMSFVLTDEVNFDDFVLDFDSGNLPVISFSVADQKVYFDTTSPLVNDAFDAVINPGSRCVIEYDKATNKWAMLVDGTLAGISTYDPTTNLPVQLRIRIAGTASDPGAGFSDFRIYSGHIETDFVPLSIYQYHPAAAFPGFPPEVDQGIADQVIDDSAPWSFQFPADAFTDPQADNVYTATLDDDSPLPAGMVLTSATRTFDWPVPVAAVYQIKVTATNTEGSVFDIFQLTVNAAPAAQDSTRRRYLLKGVRR